MSSVCSIRFCSMPSLICNKNTDDTIARKVNASDASAFARICGCCPAQGPLHFPFPIFLHRSLFSINYHSVWGVIWLIQALIFFALGIIVGLVAFKVHSIHSLPPSSSLTLPKPTPGIGRTAEIRCGALHSRPWLFWCPLDITRHVRNIYSHMRAWGVGFVVNGLVMLYLLSRLSLRHR